MHDHAAGLHGHHHGAHGHAHAVAPMRLDRAFAVGIAINAAFTLVEVSVGLLSGSLALVADAGHNLSDVMGLALAWGATGLARRRPSPRLTYGFRRSSIFASLLNSVVLLIAVGGIAVEAVRRLWEPAAVMSGALIGVAALGVVVNGAGALLFLGGRGGDINIRASFLHLAADALVSAAVIAAGILIRLTGWGWVDPLTGLAIAAVITYGTWGILREGLVLAMDGVPPNIDPRAVETYLRTLPGVVAVHDLHIWAMSTTDTALTVHLVRPRCPADDALLARAGRELRDRFGIGHATFQVELGEEVCELSPAEVI